MGRGQTGSDDLLLYCYWLSVEFRVRYPERVLTDSRIRRRRKVVTALMIRQVRANMNRFTHMN